jgi:hypothetical protein
MLMKLKILETFQAKSHYTQPQTFKRHFQDSQCEIKLSIYRGMWVVILRLYNIVLCIYQRV